MGSVATHDIHSAFPVRPHHKIDQTISADQFRETGRGSTPY